MRKATVKSSFAVAFFCKMHYDKKEDSINISETIQKHWNNNRVLRWDHLMRIIDGGP